MKADETDDSNKTQFKPFSVNNQLSSLQCANLNFSELEGIKINVNTSSNGHNIQVGA